MQLFSFATTLVSVLIAASLTNALPLAKPSTDSHTYTFRELQPKHADQSRFQQPYFRFNIFLRKNPSITEDVFHRHWKSVHADLTMSQKDAGLRLIRYTQFHQDAAHRSKIQPLINVTAGLLEIAPYDGVAEFLTKDYETFEKFVLQIFNDPVLVADQQGFVDARSAMHVMAGYDELVYGDAIDAARGRNGILPGDKRLKCSKGRCAV